MYVLVQKRSGLLGSTHGMSKTRFYNIWVGMKRRCLNKNDSAYLNYGGRGIKICDEWLKFENFKNDMYESYIKHAEIHTEKNTTIERVENNKGYSVLNCKWATYIEQNRNTRQVKLYKYKGKELNLMEISKLEGINYRTLRDRVLLHGWALSDSVKKEKWIKKNSVLYKYKGELLTISEIAKREGIGKTTLFNRLKKQNLSLEDAISIPDYQKEFKAICLKTGKSYIYKSQSQFAKDFGWKDRGKISSVLSGDRKKTRGFTFEYLD